MSKSGVKLNNSFSNAALIFGIGCIVPLFNFLAAPLSIIFGIMAVYKINKYPKKYGGMIRAVIGLTFGSLAVLATLYGLVVFGPSIFVRN